MEDVTTLSDHARFRRLFDLTYDDLCRFVRRRIHDGDDVVAQTFEIAWRRFDQVPSLDGDARAWLFGVARKLMANRRRKDARMLPWAGAGLDSPAPDEHGAAEARIDLGRAFGRLAARDQECLALVAWEGLTPTQAAEVLGVSVNAFTVRLHRARRRLRAALTEPITLATLAAHLHRTAAHDRSLT